MAELPLFVYGTLQDADMRELVLGRRLPPHQIESADAPGYRVAHYPDRSYPALLAAPEQTARGLLLRGLSPLDMALLDAFEGDEYRRADIEVLACGPRLALAYLPNLPIGPIALAWSLDTWRQQHKAEMLDREAGKSAAERERLAAWQAQQ